LQRKKVYLNDIMIGEAHTWTEVRKLLKRMSVRFTGTPGMAEGPTGFYISGRAAIDEQTASGKAGDVA